MDTLNMNDIKLDLESKAVKNIFKNLTPYLYLLNQATLMAILQNELSLLMAPINILGTYDNFHNRAQKYWNISREELYSYIRETEEYKKMRILYKEYLKNISEMLKFFKIDKSINLTMYIEKLIKSGNLSLNQNFKYKKYKYHAPETPELIGAKIATGTGVCRNIASLSRDILLELEVNAAILEVRMCNKSHPEILSYFPYLQADHAVVGVIGEQGKYIADPTNHFYATTSEEYYQSEKYNNIIAQIICNESQKFFYINNKANIQNYQNEQSFHKFNNQKYMKFTEEELQEREAEVSELFKKNSYEHQFLYNRNKELIEELALLSYVLSPYSNDERPNWVLHKSIK